MSLMCGLLKRAECLRTFLDDKRQIALVVMVLLASTAAHAYEDMPKNLKQGWDGDVQLGALATYGLTDSSAISARTTISFRSARWEHELDSKWYRSASEALVSRRDSDGEIMRDVNDEEIKDLVSSTTNNRRFISGQTRWFFSSKHYLFAIADLDINTPANLESSTRQISGVGYKLYRGKSDLLGAAIGVGRKKRVDVSGASEQGAIGYLAFRYKRKLNDLMTVSFDLNSDFGSENRYSEAETSLTWKLRDPVSLKLKYEARFNSTVIDPLNTFDDELEAALSVNLAVEIF
ncbi:MAG: YdiY family protein [Granulosicoccus sp.]